MLSEVQKVQKYLVILIFFEHVLIGGNVRNLFLSQKMKNRIASLLEPIHPFIRNSNEAFSIEIWQEANLVI